MAATTQESAHNTVHDMTHDMTHDTTQVRAHAHALLPAEARRLTGTLRLRDGAEVHVRALRPDDRHRLQELHQRLSFDTIVFRFFRALPRLDDEAARHLTHLDYDGRMALVASQGAGNDERLLAVVRYERLDSQTAEVAFVVEDAWQGRGIATALLHLLTRYARSHGFTSLVAATMGNNVRMLDVLQHCGFPTSARFESGEVRVRLDITTDPSADFTLDYTPTEPAH